jgi:hypothetical protein
MGGDLGRRVPALIAVFELAGTAVALQRGRFNFPSDNACARARGGIKIRRERWYY